MTFKATLLATSLLSFTSIEASSSPDLELPGIHQSPSFEKECGVWEQEETACAESYFKRAADLKNRDYRWLETLHAELKQPAPVNSAWRPRCLRLFVVGVVMNEGESRFPDLQRYRDEMVTLGSVENLFISTLTHLAKQNGIEMFSVWKDHWQNLQNIFLSLPLRERALFYQETDWLVKEFCSRFRNMRRNIESFAEENMPAPKLELLKSSNLEFYQNKSQTQFELYQELNKRRPLNMDLQPELVELAITGPLYAFLALRNGPTPLNTWMTAFVRPDLAPYIRHSPFHLAMLHMIYKWIGKSLPEVIKNEYEAILSSPARPINFSKFLEQLESVYTTSPVLDCDLRNSTVESLLSGQKGTSFMVKGLIESASLANRFIGFLAALALNPTPEEVKLFKRPLTDLVKQRKEFSPHQELCFKGETEELELSIYKTFPILKHRMQAITGPFQELSSGLLDFVEALTEDPKEMLKKRMLKKRMSILARQSSMGHVFTLQALYNWGEEPAEPAEAQRLSDLIQGFKNTNTEETLHYVQAMQEASEQFIEPLKERIKLSSQSAHNEEELNSTAFLNSMEDLHDKDLISKRKLRRSLVECLSSNQTLEEKSTLIHQLLNSPSFPNTFIGLLAGLTFTSKLSQIKVMEEPLKTFGSARKKFTPSQEAEFKAETQEFELFIYDKFPIARYCMQSVIGPFQELSCGLFEFLEGRISDLNHRIVTLKKSPSIENMLTLQALYSWLDHTKEVQDLQTTIQNSNQVGASALLQEIKEIRERMVDPFKEKSRRAAIELESLEADKVDTTTDKLKKKGKKQPVQNKDKKAKERKEAKEEKEEKEEKQDMLPLREDMRSSQRHELALNAIENTHQKQARDALVDFFFHPKEEKSLALDRARVSLKAISEPQAQSIIEEAQDYAATLVNQDVSMLSKLHLEADAQKASFEEKPKQEIAPIPSKRLQQEKKLKTASVDVGSLRAFPLLHSQVRDLTVSAPQIGFQQKISPSKELQQEKKLEAAVSVDDIDGDSQALSPLHTTATPTLLENAKAEVLPSISGELIHSYPFSTRPQAAAVVPEAGLSIPNNRSHLSPDTAPLANAPVQRAGPRQQTYQQNYTRPTTKPNQDSHLFYSKSNHTGPRFSPQEQQRIESAYSKGYQDAIKHTEALSANRYEYRPAFLAPVPMSGISADRSYVVLNNLAYFTTLDDQGDCRFQVNQVSYELWATPYGIGFYRKDLMGADAFFQLLPNL